MKVLIAGASGFIGRAVVHRCLKAGIEVSAVVRDTGRAAGLFDGAVQLISWKDLDRGMTDAEAVLNFSGANIAARRWTAQRKAELRASRIETTRQIVTAIARSQTPPRVFLNASAVGYYGDRGDEVLTEKSSPGSGFLAELCQEWEATAQTATPYCRVVCMRFGVVLGPGGGMVGKLMPMISTVGATIPGSGHQWVSWIAMEDVLSAVEWLLTHEEVAGAVNLVAPEPVTMEILMRTFAQACRRPVWFRVPVIVLRSVLGEMATTLTDSIRALPYRLQEGGFDFRVQTIAQFFAGSRMSS